MPRGPVPVLLQNSETDLFPHSPHRRRNSVQRDRAEDGAAAVAPTAAVVSGSGGSPAAGLPNHGPQLRAGQGAREALAAHARVLLGADSEDTLGGETDGASSEGARAAGVGRMIEAARSRNPY